MWPNNFRYSTMLAALILLSIGIEIQAGGLSICPAISTPHWGVVSCTDENNAGSKCNLSCQAYFDLVGTTDDSIETSCGFDGMWSTATEFDCVPIRCFPEQVSPEHGEVICSAKNFAQSVCVFFCKEHFDMVGLSAANNAHAICQDDGDGDEIGQWVSSDGSTDFQHPFPPECQPIRCPSSMQAPLNGQVICSNRDYSGSYCVLFCRDGFKFKSRKEKILFSSCNRGEGYDSVGEWSMPDAPSCRQCTRAEEIQLVALIHDSEGDQGQYQVATSMIAKVLTILRRRHGINPTLRVNRYSSSVDASQEVFTTAFTLKSSKKEIDAIPYPGKGANTTAALQYMDQRLTGDRSAKVAFIFTNELRDFDAEMEMKARNLVERDVSLFVFTLPQKNRARTWIREQLVKITRDDTKVYGLPKMRFTNKYKDEVAAKINDITMTKGCDFLI